MEELKFNVNKFIELVENYESIWNYKSLAYTHKTQRTFDWLTVCRGMVKNFDEKSDDQKEDILAYLKGRWRLLRDGYARSLKMQKERTKLTGIAMKPYTYHEKLHFLENLLTVHGIRRKRKDKNSSTKETLPINDGRELSTEKNETKTSQSTTETVNNGNVNDNQDTDKQFLMSLINDFKKIPESVKLDAKCDLINIIRQYVNLQPQPQVQLTEGNSFENVNVSAPYELGVDQDTAEIDDDDDDDLDIKPDLVMDLSDNDEPLANN